MGACRSDGAIKQPMRRSIELRIPEEHASQWLKDVDGVRLGDSVRKLNIVDSDPRMLIVAEADFALKKQGRVFFTSWKQRWTYTKAELEAAALFRFEVTAIFNGAGEKDGTKYDEAVACPHCGSGAKQIGPLILDVRKIPTGKSFAKTIGGETVVTHQVVDLFRRNEVSGVQFHVVRAKGAKDLKPSGWYQLSVKSMNAEITAPTKFGVDPFDSDRHGEYRCSSGDLLGLNLLSEISVRSSTGGLDDIVSSREFVGAAAGF